MKIWLWVHRAMFILMAVCLFIGVTVGTQASRSYDERSYFLLLTMFAFLLCFKFGDWADEVKKKIKEKQEAKSK